jgi:hypothetical protein
MMPVSFFAHPRLTIAANGQTEVFCWRRRVGLKSDSWWRRSICHNFDLKRDTTGVNFTIGENRGTSGRLRDPGETAHILLVWFDAVILFQRSETVIVDHPIAATGARRFGQVSARSLTLRRIPDAGRSKRCLSMRIVYVFNCKQCIVTQAHRTIR